MSSSYQVWLDGDMMAWICHFLSGSEQKKKETNKKSYFVFIYEYILCLTPF